ncbi:MAG TPA: SCP2 sterol-binding domain-containing protein [Steroidobacteraceae bacterium]|nr:SCP2 sterol-binding domain-containing protein [Steroidobacteraceae bacterium]
MLTGTLEQLANRGLPRSVRARALCAELAGRSLAVEVPGLTRLRVTSNGVTLGIARSDAPADTTLTGGVLALWGLAGDSPEAVVQRGDVVISGDTHLAEQFRELGRLLRPDPEEELALLVGDVAAHRLGRVARAALRLPRRAAGTAFVNLAEYLGHERGDLVPRREGEQFLRGVDTLREDVDRAAARLELLARRRGVP